MSSSSKTILLVEDDPDQVLMYEVALKAAGYKTLSASTEEETLALASQKDPNLILLDLLLGGEVFGVKILEELKANKKTRHIKIIVLTNFQREGLARRCIKKGAEAYLQKSKFEPQKLTEELTKYL